MQALSVAEWASCCACPSSNPSTTSDATDSGTSYTCTPPDNFGCYCAAHPETGEVIVAGIPGDVAGPCVDAYPALLALQSTASASLTRGCSTCEACATPSVRE